MFTNKFMIDTLERALKTFCQFIVTLAGVVAPVNGLNLLTLNWGQILMAASIGALISIAMSIISSFSGDPSSASLIK